MSLPHQQYEAYPSYPEPSNPHPPYGRPVCPAGPPLQPCFQGQSSSDSQRSIEVTSSTHQTEISRSAAPWMTRKITIAGTVVTGEFLLYILGLGVFLFISSIIMFAIHSKSESGALLLTLGILFLLLSMIFMGYSVFSIWKLNELDKLEALQIRQQGSGPQSSQGTTTLVMPEPRSNDGDYYGRNVNPVRSPLRMESNSWEPMELPPPYQANVFLESRKGDQ